MPGLVGEIDVVLVATRRPELLEGMLASFWANLLGRLKVGRFLVNIDPLWGDEEDDRAVERICRSYVADAVMRRPEKPSFGAAVKWLWSQPATAWFVHLEEDWLMRRRVDLRRLASEMQPPDVTQISFSRAHRKAWRRGVWVDRFATSPSLVRTSFGKLVSSLQNPDLDPEKQMWGPQNPALSEAICGKFRHRLHGPRFTRDYLMDTGRAWREARKIEKKLIDGRSVWIQSG
jgi:hypothetical protein